MTRKSIAVVTLALVFGIAAIGAHAQGRGSIAAERFVLNGVILFEGGGLAWLQEPSLTGDRAVVVRLSDSIGPYRLTRILDDRVELEGPAGTVLVPLLNAQVGPGPAVAVASPSGSASSARATSPQGGDARDQAASLQAEAAQVQADAVRMKALRDHQEASRTLVERMPLMQGSSSTPNQQQTRPANDRSADSPSRVPSGSPTMQSGAAPGAIQGGVSTPQTDGVVYAEKGQTFQGILGLK